MGTFVSRADKYSGLSRLEPPSNGNGGPSGSECQQRSAEIDAYRDRFDAIDYGRLSAECQGLYTDADRRLRDLMGFECAGTSDQYQTISQDVAVMVAELERDCAEGGSIGGLSAAECDRRRRVHATYQERLRAFSPDEINTECSQHYDTAATNLRALGRRLCSGSTSDFQMIDARVQDALRNLEQTDCTVSEAPVIQAGISSWLWVIGLGGAAYVAYRQLA